MKAQSVMATVVAGVSGATVATLAALPPFIFSEDVEKKIGEAFGDELKARNKWVLVTDYIWSKGMRPVHLDAKRTDTVENRNKVRAIVVSKMDKDIQKILAAETKSLSQMEKGIKAYWQTQVGSLIGKLESKLKDREEQETLTDAQKDAKAKKTLHQRLQRDLDAFIKKYQEIEKPEFDVTECVKLLNQVKKITPSV
jgi:molecular chaperone DnaK (HSP70)